MRKKKFDEAAKHYGVTAELFVNGAELKPKALFKAAEALDKAGRKSEASQYRARLQKEFPDWKQEGSHCRRMPARRLERLETEWRTGGKDGMICSDCCPAIWGASCCG